MTTRCADAASAGGAAVSAMPCQQVVAGDGVGIGGELRHAALNERIDDRRHGPAESDDDQNAPKNGKR